MTQLSRSQILGIGKESTPGTYAPPTIYIPFTKADFEDQYTYIRDQSIRANDTVLQGSYQGPVVGDWSIDVMAYPDVIGPFLRNVIGPDTVVAGASTTLSASSIVGATSISTAASIAANTYVKVGTGLAVEYAKVTAVSGTGPYTLTVTTSDTGPVGLTQAHASSDPVVAASTHTFKQNYASKATHSLTVFDTLTTYGYADCVFSDLGIKIDPKGAVTLTTKAKSMPGVSQSVMTPTFTSLPPSLGWQWQMTNAGGSSTRGLTYDLAIKRQVDPIWSSDGTQAPREIFQGSLEADATYKAIFENTTDLNLYLNNTQLPCTATMQQPIRDGGGALALTLSKSGWMKGMRDWTADYVEASFSASGIYNTTDGGAVSAVLTNFVTTAY